MESDRKIREKIRLSLIEADLGELNYDDIAFHMTDWVDDLRELVAFYENPAEYDAEHVADLMFKFLVHVPNHLAAASKLLLDAPLTDVFGVKAVSEQQDNIS